MSIQYDASDSKAESVVLDILRIFNVVLFGEGNVGKTTFMKRCQGKEFEEKYLPTTGANVCPLMFQTSKGKIQLNVWDIGASELHAKSDQDPGDFRIIRLCEYCREANADAIMIMFDRTSISSFERMSYYYDGIQQCLNMCHLPFMICGNKCDLESHSTSDWELIAWRSDGRQKFPDYYDVSAKSDHFEKPWLNLMRKLTGDSELELTK